MEQQEITQEPKRGSGKESQLSRIAASINMASAQEANPSATQSMITTFVNKFNSAALEIIQTMDDDQEDLIKNMVDEITKLQTKNMQEFEKAINKIVGISNKMIESNNPKLAELGKDLQDQAKNELIKSSGFNLTGEDDTFKNRLKRQIIDTGNIENEDETKSKVSGLGKIRGFFSDAKKEFKKGFGAAIEEGSVADNIFRSDEEKRQRLLSRVDETASESKTESLNESFKKIVEEILNQKKTDTKVPESNPVSETDSEEQEDRAGISKDAEITALEKSADSNLIIQQNTTESTEILGKLLEEVKKIAELMISNQGQGDGGGGGVGFIRGSVRPGTRPRSVRGRARLARMQARTAGRGVVGAITRIGGNIASSGRGALGGIGRVLGFGAAGLGAAGTAAAVGAAIPDAPTGSTGSPATTAAAASNSASRPGILGRITGGASNIASKVGNFFGFGSSASPSTPTSGATGSARPAGLGSKTMSMGGRALGALGIGLDVFDRTTSGQSAGQVATGVGGGVAGGLLGAKVGGALGVLGGPAAPVTVPLGALVGGGLGYFGGGAAGDAAYNAVSGTGKQSTPTSQPTTRGTAERPQQGLFSRAMEMASNNKGMMAGAALGPIGMAGGALVDSLSGSRGKTETGRNIDSAIIEAGTKATKDKMIVNVPPPTVINQGNQGGQQSGPTITAPGGVRNVRSDDPTWLMFQKRRAVA